MKNIALTIMMLCLSVAMYADDAPKLTLKTTMHDFGQIAERGGVVSAVFEFENNSSAPLVITRVYVNCSCTKVEYPKRPVKGGDKGVIKVTFDPKKQIGTFLKPIQIYSNAATKKDVITIKGEVR